jgi:hypothetical protein
MRDVREKLDEQFRSTYSNYAMRGIVLRSLAEGGINEAILKHLWRIGDSDRAPEEALNAVLPLNDLMTTLFMCYKGLPSVEDKAYFVYVFAAILAKRDEFDMKFRSALRQIAKELGR